MKRSKKVKSLIFLYEMVLKEMENHDYSDVENEEEEYVQATIELMGYLDHNFKLGLTKIPNPDKIEDADFKNTMFFLKKLSKVYRLVLQRKVQLNKLPRLSLYGLKTWIQKTLEDFQQVLKPISSLY